MTPVGGNLFADLPDRLAQEQIAALLAAPNLRIERIVSIGHCSPPGDFYDQEWAEWVVVLQGSARLLFEGDAEPKLLKPGDYVHIPPHARHRVEWTDPQRPTVWLAIHYFWKGVSPRADS
jgi:cupin 2 domain-containing protein